MALELAQLSPTLGSAVDTWATVAVAIGTIGAVAYALFRDLIIAPRRRPRLDLRFDPAGNDRSAHDAAPMQLDVNPKPTGGQHILEPGTYEISIEIRARNADALRYVVPLSCDGKWSDKAALWDHLRVEPLQRVP